MVIHNGGFLFVGVIVARKKNWFLCLIGIHTRGTRTNGCRYNISVCRWCKRDVLFVLKEEKE